MKAQIVIMGILVLCRPSVAGQLPHVYEATYSRSQIEALSPAERAPLLEWLDAARACADRELERLASRHVADAFDEMATTARIERAGFDRRDLEREIGRRCGTIRGYRYSAQRLLERRDGPIDARHDLTRARSMVYYAVQSSKHPYQDVYLAVETIALGGRQCVRYLWFQDGRPEPDRVQPAP